MSTLLVHFVSDFLRDTPPAAGQFGEALRCAVMQDENVALQAYGLDAKQRQVLLTKDRQRIVDALSNEIGAVMDEVDGSTPVFYAYPAGTVELREVKVIFSAGNNRTILVRGTGFDNPAVDVLPRGGGPPSAANIVSKECDRDVWQRLYVSVQLPAGSYTLRVTRASGAQGTKDFDAA